MSADTDAERFLAPLLLDLAASANPSRAYDLPRMTLAVRTRLLDAPPSVVPWLARFLADAPCRGIAQRTDVAHAVQLLGALGAGAELPVLFDTAVKLAEDPVADRENGSPVFGALGEAFRVMGDVVVGALAEYLDGEPHDIGLLLVLVGDADTRDARLLSLLVDALDRFPCEAATALLLHGDQSAVPALRARLARLADRGNDDAWCRAAMSLTHAIHVLGGELANADREREQVALDRHRVLYARAADQVADDETEGLMLTNGDPATRVSLARAAHAHARTTSILARLATDREWTVRQAVADADGAPQPMIALLAHDHHPAVAAVAQRRLDADRVLRDGDPAKEDR